MTDNKVTDTKATDGKPAIDNGFFVNNGTFTGNLTTPDGDKYDLLIRPREVTDPRDGTVSTIWGGYANARDINLSAKDSMLKDEFKHTGQRPAELFQAESRDIPLYVTLRERPGAKGYSHIGSLWTSKGRFTVLARDLDGKNGLRFGGNVLPWKTPEALAAEKAAAPERPAAKPAEAAKPRPGGAG